MTDKVLEKLKQKVKDREAKYIKRNEREKIKDDIIKLRAKLKSLKGR